MLSPLVGASCFELIYELLSIQLGIYGVINLWVGQVSGNNPSTANGSDTQICVQRGFVPRWDRVTIDNAEVMISYGVASLCTKAPQTGPQSDPVEIGWPYTQRTIKYFIYNKGSPAVENFGSKAHVILKSKAIRIPLKGVTWVHYLTKSMAKRLSPVKAHTVTPLLIAHIY